jgi:hypothetical protein
MCVNGLFKTSWFTKLLTATLSSQRTGAYVQYENKNEAELATQTNQSVHTVMS